MKEQPLKFSSTYIFHIHLTYQYIQLRASAQRFIEAFTTTIDGPSNHN